MRGPIVERFEAIISEMFQLEGLIVEPAPQFDRFRADMLVTSPSGESAIVEVKLYRSREVSVDLILKAIDRLEIIRRSNPRLKTILVIGSDIPDQVSHGLRANYPGVILYDHKTVRSISAKYPQLLNKLDEVLREAYPSSALDRFSEATTDIVADIQRAPTEVRSNVTLTTKGGEIIEWLNSIRAGRKDAREFELALSEALKYIFEEDLVAWSEQKITHDGLSRYDLIAKVSSSHDFWKFISSSMRSLYIIFEFKNYSEKIKQGQIYTTEKYLYCTAMRSMAVIISRGGADENAMVASRGALRESGKLIVNLTVGHIKTMLERRDAGDDANAILVDIVDDMLMRLTR